MSEEMKPPDVVNNINLWYNENIMGKVCEINYDGDLVPASLRCGKGSMFRTPMYKAFRETISWLLKAGYIGGCRNDRLYRVDIDMRQNCLGNKRKFYRGDIDNMTKPILDSATGIIWKDDGQIAELRVRLNRESVDSGFNAKFYDIAEWHNYRDEIICLNCGKSFLRLKSQIRYGHNKFCSNKCKREYHRVKHNCLNCGKEFTFVCSSIRGTKFCSFKCYWAYMKEHPKEYPNILSNLRKATAMAKVKNKKGQFKRKSYAIAPTLLRQLMERCQAICEECGQPPDWRGLAPHHIIHRSQGGKDVLDNLKMLCGKCHSKAHGIKEILGEIACVAGQGDDAGC